MIWAKVWKRKIMTEKTNLNNTLITKERRSNHELQEARKVLIKGLDGFANNGTRPPAIGIKRMGELNDKPFRDICIKKFLTTERETKSVSCAHCGKIKYKIQGGILRSMCQSMKSLIAGSYK